MTASGTFRPGMLLACTGAIGLGAVAIVSWQTGWSDVWTTPDQRGRWAYEHQRYAEAAESFHDPLWRGAALMRAGDFKRAAEVFGGLDTAEAAYNQGNALVMLGKYDEAIVRYDRALALRPGWADAAANKRLAQVRAERMKAPGGDLGDQREGADQIVYDKSKQNQDGQATETAGSVMSDAATRALWLKRVQTRPGDFLRARFAAQAQAPLQPAQGSRP